MEKVDEKLIDIYELLGDYLEKAGYFKEKEVEDKEVDDDNDEKEETYTEEEVQEILNRE